MRREFSHNHLPISGKSEKVEFLQLVMLQHMEWKDGSVWRRKKKPLCEGLEGSVKISRAHFSHEDRRISHSLVGDTYR